VVIKLEGAEGRMTVKLNLAGVDRSDQAQNGIQRRAVVNTNEASGSVNGEGFE
jgi:hypothetical protein